MQVLARRGTHACVVNDRALPSSLQRSMLTMSGVPQRVAASRGASAELRLHRDGHAARPHTTAAAVQHSHQVFTHPSVIAIGDAGDVQSSLVARSIARCAACDWPRADAPDKDFPASPICNWPSCFSLGHLVGGARRACEQAHWWLRGPRLIV